MVLQHVWGLFTNPKREWEAIRDDECTIGKCYAIHVLMLAAIPAISGFIGTTQFGWQIGAGDPVKLTLQSAEPDCGSSTISQCWSGCIHSAG